MRLLHLSLRNFRQHADTRISFGPGLTGIIGPNGAGKSTLLEGIAWAVYGSSAARGTNDTLRFNRAPPRARVEVELEFALGAHEYRVVRSLSHAEVFQDGGSAPVAATLGGTTSFLQSRLGMSREEFFNTYFTGQKELQFLGAMGPADRGRFLSQVLGYERLRRAQDRARARRTELRHEVRGLRAAVADPGEVRAARVESERRVAQALAALDEARAAQAEAVERLTELTPRWEEAQLQRERARELAHHVERAAAAGLAALREREAAEAQLAEVGRAEAALEPMRERLRELPGLTTECARLAELARQEERRKALSAQAGELADDLARSLERLGRLEQAPELERRYAAELEALREARASLEAELDEQKTAWHRDRQDAQTKLQTFRDRGAELKEQIRQLRELGPEGTCPTCGRPVGEDHPRLLEELEEQWAGVLQDGRWWKSRAEQLEPKPPEIAGLETRLRGATAEVEEKARKHTRCRAAVEELAGVRSERAVREERLGLLRAELEEIPPGYDEQHHRGAETRLAELRELETRAARLEETASRRGVWERQRTEAVEREDAAARQGREAGEERERLSLGEEAFVELREAFEGAAARQRSLELRATELRGELQTAEQALQTARRAEAEQARREAEVREREVDLAHHEELDLAYSELRTELNAQVRPELSEIASAFLAQLTDGRYTSMEIDEAYNLLVLDEGEEKPVISGGEEDIANLVLRLSLSQMIAERAGHPLSLLILDEVFGSLDLARRDNVVQLLHHLEDRFDQVILITHVEGIRESMDHVLRVEFDERTGTARVHEEGATARLSGELAAD